MTQMLIRAAWALVLALSVLPVGRHAVAQSQFPTALTSSEFEALLPRLGVPDAQRAAAMAEYDRYQRATSELRSGAIERYLKDQPGGGALFAMGDDDRPADEVRNRVRTYRSLLAQWDTLENALVDSLPALGADAITVDRVRRSMELRRIEQSTADGFMMRLGSQADLWAIAERSTKDLDPTQRTLIDDRIAAREAEYVEAVRAVRTAAFNQPELLLELKAKANADHPQPSAEAMRQQMEQAQEQGGELDPSGFSKGFEAHFRAMAAAFQQSREPVQAARLRATRLGAGILRDAFQGIPQPRGASAWLAFVRASGSGSFGVDDGGAIRLVESMVAKAPLTPEQDQAVAAAFDAWQTAVLAALDGQGPLAFIDAGAEDMQATIRKREEAAQARTAALKAGVRSALGLPTEAEAVAQDPPDGGEREQGAPVNVAVRVGVAIADGEVGDGDVAVGGNAVVLDMAGEGLEVGDEGGPMLWQGAGRPAIQPLGKQDLQVILELCGPADSVKPVIEQMHADYLEVAGAVTAQLDAAPSAQMSFGPDGPKSPSKDDIAAKYDAIRTAFAAMERADADFFADLAAVVDEACVRQQAQYRARELARAAAGGAGSSIGFGMVGGAGSGPFVDPESVIRAAVVDGALDAPAAATLREYVAAQGHEPILAALRSQVEVTLTKGRELALLEADLFQPAADGEAGAAMTIDAEASQRMQAAGEAMATARGESSARARQVLDALPALLKEPQRPGFLRAADVVRYPETFKDPTDMEPMFAKALALADLVTATMSAITTQRSEYRTAYAALRDQLTQVRPKAVMPEFSGAEEGGIEDFQARMNASQAAGRQLKQLKTDRDELNRRTMRQLQATLGEERAKAIGELPAQRKGRGLSIPGLGGVQFTVP